MPGPMGGMRGHFLTEEEKQAAPKVTKELILRVLSCLKPYWKQLAVVLAAILTSSVLNLLPSILTGRIVDEGLLGRNMPMLLRYVGLSLTVMLAANLIGVLESYLNAWIAQHVTFDLRNRMFRHLQGMSQRFFTTNRQGDVITRMTSDIDGVQQVISGTFTGILSNALTLAAAVIAMYRRSWVLATIGVLVVPLFALPTRTAGRTRWALTRQSQACNDEVNGILNETLSVSGQLLVKLFGREEDECRRYESANRRMVELNIRERMAGRWFMVAISTFSGVGPMLLYLVGGILMMRYGADLTVGDVTVLVALLGRIYGPVNQLLNIQVDWVRAMALFSRLFGYLDMPAEIESPAEPVWPAARDAKGQGRVAFENVSFAYEPEREVLHSVSFELEPGKCAAIVAASGSGKSTMIRLIPRLYDVTGGCVLFDGADVRTLDLGWLRANVGIVSQETYLFNGTIRDNLLYARPDATEQELIDACKKANIYDFIAAQDKGLDTLVGNRGLKLSGGEKQRISIARVLLKDPALLIFDEATSALDSISEQKIQDAVEPLLRSRTSILIAHRLSTVLAADEILVMDGGRIAERGTHAELLKRSGVYRELYDTQFAAAEERAMLRSA
ncbi:MAG: ABC transporter ATP-binding protein [Ruminococcaceae bacterium]|nr:ABC transporter ATP-binding protein [Oscillospiraceae bacterium]